MATLNGVYDALRFIS